MGGFVLDVEGLPLRCMTIELTDKERRVHATTTSIKGEYTFSNLCPGRSTLTAGDQKFPVAIKEDHSPLSPARLTLKGVRRVLDLSTAPVWEVREALGLSSETVQRIGANLHEIHDARTLAKLAGVDAARLSAWTKAISFKWPKRRPRTKRAKR